MNRIQRAAKKCVESLGWTWIASNALTSVSVPLDSKVQKNPDKRKRDSGKRCAFNVSWRKLWATHQFHSGDWQRKHHHPSPPPPTAPIMIVPGNRRDDKRERKKSCRSHNISCALWNLFISRESLVKNFVKIQSCMVYGFEVVHTESERFAYIIFSFLARAVRVCVCVYVRMMELSLWIATKKVTQRIGKNGNNTNWRKLNAAYSVVCVCVYLCLQYVKILFSNSVGAINCI